MKMVNVKIVHGYYNIFGYLPMEAAMHVANNWVLVGAKVEVGETIIELNAANLVELRIIGGRGRYISVYVAPKSAVATAKRITKAFDMEVMVSIGGKEYARFDMQLGRPVVRRPASYKRVALTLVAA